MNPSLQDTLVEVAHEIAALGFVASYDGNISLRSEEGIYITASHTLKRKATRADVCLLSLDGKWLEGTRPPSTESEMHLFIYRHRPDVGGIVHTHPIATTAFAVARCPLDAAIFPEVILDIGTVPLAEYATPSTFEVATSLSRFIQDANAVLLANHGVVVMGQDVWQALYRTEKLEHAAKTLIMAEQLGGPKLLTQSQLQRLFETHPTFTRRSGFRTAPEPEYHQPTPASLA
ncbi:MAG: class II aldolase/adducin family protein [Chloroherpetonaceae bacterium]|nr:class II aldolase/adducin family protein [Chloroherpetonaceae bacterium]MCS7211858.1 class II aldolase/adducin family protein [Chloroherpetonaceae bacterium]MDW8019620.1 class II aldolase/adducin family protein [Chloroherpetonaceae bacterium]